MFRKKDLFLILPFLALGLLLLLWTQLGGGNGGVAVVEENGVEIRRFDLAKQASAEEIDLGGPYAVKLLLEPGAVSFLESGCPDQVCVRTGRLTKPGQVAVCLPAKLSVRVTGGESEVDGTTG